MTLLRRWRTERGQITIDSGLGKWLSLLTVGDDVQTVVEVGAWHGGGSTAILAKSARQRSLSGFRVWSLEANHDRAAEAAALHAENPHIEVVWGVIVDIDQLDSYELSEDEQEWFDQDVDWIGTAPNVLDRLPRAIDLLLLDGGEFSTYSEFQTLESRLVTWLLLDDTHTRKCERIYRELVEDRPEDFELIWKSSERNGTAVFRRRSEK